MNQRISRGDISILMTRCMQAKNEFPEIFSRKIRSRGFPLKLDADGKKISKDDEKDTKVAKTLWILPKEPTCHRCGHVDDVPGEKKESQCPKCAEKYKGVDLSSAMPGWTPDRDSACKEIAKNYLDQARALVGTSPIEFSSWISEDGLKVICKILKHLDENYVQEVPNLGLDVVGASGETAIEVEIKREIRKVDRVMRTAPGEIHPGMVNMRRMSRVAIPAKKKEEYRPDFLPCMRPVV